MIVATAPVRICDQGGWTDTWFGGPGRILNIAVAPGIEISIRATAGPDPVIVNVGGESYPIVPGRPRVARHALVEAAIDSLPPPPDRTVAVTVRSAVPAGCGAGTSAALAVALLGGLATLRSERPSRREVAYGAHRLEVDVLGGQSGIQDQLSAAFGGINYLEIDRYPDATVESLPPWDELDARLTLVFLGRPHDSSALHRQVIDQLGDGGAAVFPRLREAAMAAREAVLARDLEAFGRALIANTRAQATLHAGLVGHDARRVIDMAAGLGALGWKVNGAGGDGGSLTILSASPPDQERLQRRVPALDPRYQVVPIHISPAGLEVRGSL